ncbi:uncharacterized mitochondrial protein AtMg00810-like [Impatiens glandulifera]|uniref:uncharacterized mitochondrial protein AtMg00810-like n=1 Tax=Impatiens glandulifera TaxID=253017 RepID=UPI001FB15265|nr:uncharacterized mitochondrial protein AtMg00810-like [Impatiens glandulifera]
MSMMRELSFFLGLQVRQLERGTYTNHVKYTKELEKKFGMERFSPASSPMSSSIKLDKDEDGQRAVITACRGIIGSLLYLTTNRPDILFVVFDSNFNLISYFDVDYADCKVDKKSTSGTCKFFGDHLYSWYSKKQTSIETSTGEAKYLAAGSYYAQLLWIQQ